MSGQERPLQWVDDLFNKNPSELESSLNELNSIRCKYPGLCSINFEFLLDIILDKLVGHNDDKKGIFGTLEAFALAVEEQGRKTLHAHILLSTKHKLLNILKKKPPSTDKIETEVGAVEDNLTLLQDGWIIVVNGPIFEQTKSE